MDETKEHEVTRIQKMEGSIRSSGPVRIAYEFGLESLTIEESPGGNELVAKFASPCGRLKFTIQMRDDERFPIHNFAAEIVTNAAYSAKTDMLELAVVASKMDTIEQREDGTYTRRR